MVGPAKGTANDAGVVNMGGIGTSTPMGFVGTGIVRTSSAGTMQLRWAQDRPHSSATTVERDSYLQLSLVA